MPLGNTELMGLGIKNKYRKQQKALGHINGQLRQPNGNATSIWNISGDPADNVGTLEDDTDIWGIQIGIRQETGQTLYQTIQED